MAANIKITKRKLTAEEEYSFRRILKAKPPSLARFFQVGLVLAVIFGTLPFIPAVGIMDWKTRIYYWLFVVTFFPLLCFWIYFEERAKAKRKEGKVEHKLLSNFFFIETSVKKAITFDGVGDLGPYWIGDLGQGKLFLLWGQILLISKKLNKAKINAVLDSGGNIIELKPSGVEIKMTVIKDDNKNIEYEKLISNKTQYRYRAFLFKGNLKTWTQDIMRSKIQKII